METQTAIPIFVTLDAEGKVTFPRQVLERHQWQGGDKLFVMQVSEDSIVLKRLDPNKTVFDMLKELGVALREAGYDTVEKVDALVDEIKLEVTEEWLAKNNLRRDASS